jgi:putative transposase
MSEDKLQFSRDNLDPLLKDVNNWATVDTSHLSEKDAKKFEARQNAVSAYLDGSPMEEIRKEFGICRIEVLRYCKRCLSLHKDGRIYGWRALIPYERQKAYDRVAESHDNNDFTHGGDSGKLTKLFDTFPELKELVDNLFLKRLEKGIVHESRIPIKSIHKRFIDKCRQLGIKPNAYPFTVLNLGNIALWKYLKKLFSEEQERATRTRHGKEPARMLKSQRDNESIPDVATRPYQRVEFDAHLIDVFCTISIPSIFGGFIERVLDRIWLLVIIDVFTRAVIGYHLCFSKQYSADDVLLCVKNAITPWKAKELTIPELKYPEKGGMPSSVFKELEWALWDEMAYDNAKSNLAAKVKERLTSIVNCAINMGPIKTPERRPFVERFFQTLEENGYHRLPSTTGGNAKDSRREDPENKALQFRISLEHIEELTDVMIAGYNGTPHSGIGYRTPLEALSYYIDSDNILPRQIPKNRRNNLQLLNIKVIRQVRGKAASGKRPHINFEGVKYRNDVLSRSPDLVGTKLTLIIDTSDIRSVTAILPNGAEFGKLTAQGAWGRSPHTLEMRKAILALKYKKLIWYTDSDDPIQTYTDFLGKQSIKSKMARRKLAGARQSQKADNISKVESDKSESSSTLKRMQENESKEDSLNELKSKKRLPRLKTFTY